MPGASTEVRHTSAQDPAYRPARSPRLHGSIPGKNQQELQRPVVLRGHERADAGVLYAPVGERHRDVPGHLDLAADDLRRQRKGHRAGVAVQLQGAAGGAGGDDAGFGERREADRLGEGECRVRVLRDVHDSPVELRVAGGLVAVHGAHRDGEGRRGRRRAADAEMAGDRGGAAHRGLALAQQYLSDPVTDDRALAGRPGARHVRHGGGLRLGAGRGQPIQAEGCGGLSADEVDVDEGPAHGEHDDDDGGAYDPAQ